MSIFSANDITMYYELHGQGKPLVLIAGYTGDHTFWKFVVPGLAEHFQVLIFDNRGIGQTQDAGNAFTLENMAEDVIALINHLGFDKPIIAGHSMGGIIAQLIAKKYPESIRGLIILNSALTLNRRTFKTLEALLNLRKENVAFDAMIDAALPWFFSSNYLANSQNIRAFKQNLLNNPFPQSIENQERQLKAMIAYDVLDWPQIIKTKTLIVSAENDIIAPPKEGKLLAAGIPNSQFVLASDAHSSPVEQSKFVKESILDVFKK